MNEYIEGLRDCILDCIRHPDEVCRRGKNALIKARDYVWEEKIKHYNEIYETVMGR